MHPDFTRYSCQMALPGFDETTQQRLQNAKILIAGMGGLGCPAALYLAAAGIGTIGIADYDIVSVSNLHRQVLYTASEVGLKKIAIAYSRLQQQNPGIKVIVHDVKINSENVLDLIKPYDMVLDCTDNFEAKYLLNDACVLEGKPLVYGAIYQYEGQLAVWNILNADGTYTPNYRDIFKEVNSSQVPNCADGGVIPTLAGIMGCMQANEVIKYFSNNDEVLAGKLLMFDAKSMQSRIIKIGKITQTNITSLTKTSDIPFITSKHFKNGFQNNTYELIDVRTTEEHQSFNIGGKNIPLNELERKISQFNFSKPVLVYCSTGKRSGEAVKFILNKFPEVKVFSLEGGLQEWERD